MLIKCPKLQIEIRAAHWCEFCDRWSLCLNIDKLEVLQGGNDERMQRRNLQITPRH